MDEVVTHGEVLDWLRADVRRALVEAMEPRLRGWLTAAEAAEFDGPLVEVHSMSEAQPRYLPTQGWPD